MYRIPITAMTQTRENIISFLQQIAVEPLTGKCPGNPAGEWYAILPSGGRAKFKSQPWLSDIVSYIRQNTIGDVDTEIYVDALLAAWQKLEKQCNEKT